MGIGDITPSRHMRNGLVRRLYQTPLTVRAFYGSAPPKGKPFDKKKPSFEGFFVFSDHCGQFLEEQ